MLSRLKTLALSDCRNVRNAVESTREVTADYALSVGLSRWPTRGVRYLFAESGPLYDLIYSDYGAAIPQTTRWFVPIVYAGS